MNGQGRRGLSPVSILVRIYFVWHDVMLPAARFVHFARADDDDGDATGIALHEALQNNRIDYAACGTNRTSPHTSSGMSPL